MPTEKTEQKITFSAQEVIEAMAAAYPQIPTKFTVYATGWVPPEITALMRPLENLIFISDDSDG